MPLRPPSPLGHRAWAHTNSPKYDISLFFSIKTVQSLEAQLIPEERGDFMLTWAGDWDRHVLCHVHVGRVWVEKGGECLDGCQAIAVSQSVWPEKAADAEL